MREHAQLNASAPKLPDGSTLPRGRVSANFLADNFSGLLSAAAANGRLKFVPSSGDVGDREIAVTGIRIVGGATPQVQPMRPIPGMKRPTRSA